MATEELEEEQDQEESGKKKKKKKDKDNEGGGFDAMVGDNGAMFTDAEEDEGGGFSVALIIIFIVIIWLAILALLVKLDIGGFGSGVLYPLLKDVPVLNLILPDGAGSDSETESEEYATLAEAVAEINRLKRENEELKKSQSKDNTEEINAYKEEIKRLQTFEDSQVEFQKLKTEFYEEVVFSENAPSIDEYRKYYEEIDPENAEFLYKQVVAQLQSDKELSEYVKAYSDMKPQQAASIFEMMTDNLDLVAKILGRMDPTARGKILGKMDQEVAAQITKIMDPDN